MACEEAIEAAGASLRYLPPYSPDLNPIEMSYSESRHFCANAPREASRNCIAVSGNSCDCLGAKDCANYFAHAGYAAI